MTNQTATEAFISAKMEIDDLIAVIQARSEDHFDAHPDEIHWGHVGDLNRMIVLLREVVGAA